MNQVSIIQIEVTPDLVAKITLLAMQESINYRCETMNIDIYNEKYKIIVTQTKLNTSIIKRNGEK